MRLQPSRSSPVVYKLRTGLLSKFIGGKDYLEPVVIVDVVEEVLHNRPYKSSRLDSLPKEVEFGQTLATIRPGREEVDALRDVPPVFKPAAPSPVSLHSQKRELAPTSPEKGYCIRTGVTIPFNPNRPFSYAAYKKWAEFANDDYPERYCHLTGHPTNGRNSKR